ncbi:hypothetical protein GGX14DRAFT_403004 [Mycena pura]|uniref:Uncharacterized protein n=1 Tax=Mycena pura TaxID=153505 RepID=A0AAD6V3Y5_9AGAR|nr:hypothetical protein GGX14DRAFT_403004 [Mycena pura]
MLRTTRIRGYDAFAARERGPRTLIGTYAGRWKAAAARGVEEESAHALHRAVEGGGSAHAHGRRTVEGGGHTGRHGVEEPAHAHGSVDRAVEGGGGGAGRDETSRTSPRTLMGAGTGRWKAVQGGASKSGGGVEKEASARSWKRARGDGKQQRCATARVVEKEPAHKEACTGWWKVAARTQGHAWKEEEMMTRRRCRRRNSSDSDTTRAHIPRLQVALGGGDEMKPGRRGPGRE